MGGLKCPVQTNTGTTTDAQKLISKLVPAASNADWIIVYGFCIFKKKPAAYATMKLGGTFSRKRDRISKYVRNFRMRESTTDHFLW